MTAFDDKESVMSAFSNGAAGFLTKNMSLNAVSEALLSLLNNGAALSPSAARILIASVGQKMQKINSIINRLTPREREIARFIKSGLSYQQIADQLFISARTVNQHLKHIYQKVGVNSRSQLAAKMEE
jgi:DNA-binding NarL/FixJ family response regulator